MSAALSCSWSPTSGCASRACGHPVIGWASGPFIDHATVPRFFNYFLPNIGNDLAEAFGELVKNALVFHCSLPLNTVTAPATVIAATNTVIPKAISKPVTERPQAHR
jgi:hypothetical protein